MRVGKRDKSISIERLVANLDRYGRLRAAWTPIRTAKTAITQVSAEAFFGSGGLTAEPIVVFRIHYSEGVTPAERIVSSDRVFDVKEIKEFGRRHGLKLRAVAR